MGFDFDSKSDSVPLPNLCRLSKKFALKRMNNRKSSIEDRDRNSHHVNNVDEIDDDDTTDARIALRTPWSKAEAKGFVLDVKRLG